MILAAITEASEPIGPKDIADETGMRAVNVRKLLHKLVEEGTIEKSGYGRYRKAGTKPAEPPKKNPGKGQTARPKSKSDDLPYTGPVVEPREPEEPDLLDEHGALTAKGGNQ
jgi:hypothetical protein